MKARIFLLLSSLSFLLLSCASGGAPSDSASQTGSDENPSLPGESTSLGPSYPTLEEFQRKCSLSVKGNEVTIVKWIAGGTKASIPAHIKDGMHMLDVVTLGEECFQDTSLTTIEMPDTLVSIGKACFAQTNLISVTLPESVTSIGDYAFYRCYRLTSVELNDGLESIGIGAFSGCNGLRSLIIPDSVASMGRSLFKGCSALKSLTLPYVGGSKTTNAYLSYLYGALDNAHYTDAVESALKEVTVTKENIPAFAFYHLTHIEKVTLEQPVTMIGTHAFDGCTSLSSVIGLDHVTSIGTDAFKDCTALDA